MKTLLAALALLAAAAPFASAQNNACTSSVQGRVAWDYNGNKTWADSNLNALCQGTQKPAEPGLCFARVMHGGINWGGGTQWRWENALSLCKGTNSSDATVACFQAKVGQGVPWAGAIEQCRSPETACAAFVQGRISWNYSDNKTWAESNLQNLCRGTSVANMPGRCFSYVMHDGPLLPGDDYHILPGDGRRRGISWGGGTIWKWENALNLCKGVNDGNKVTFCFESKIRAGVGWQEAIQSCR